MDKADLKLLLESYRPQDANDPIFAEALQAVAADPELTAWFGQMRRFDAIMAAKFQETPVPADVKRHILLGYREADPIPERSSRRIWYVPTSIAAAILAGLFLWHVVAPPPHRIRALEQQAIAYTGQLPALQFVCYNASLVAQWVNRQPASAQVGLRLPMPDKSMSLKMIGSSMVQWDGHPVVMICLQNGKQMAMLYIMKGDEAPEMQEGGAETMQKADWVVRATKLNGQLHLLAARGGPEDLNFPMPF